jgi:flagellar motor switch protein FliM
MDALSRDEVFSGGMVVGEIHLGEGRSPGMVVMQHNLLTQLIAVLLGEDLESGSPLSQFRSLTPVERRIANRICQDLTTGLGRSWPEINGPSFEFSGLIAPSTMLETMSTVAPMYIAMMDFSSSSGPLGLMAVVLPVATFPEDEPPPRPERRTQGKSLDSLMNVEVEVVAELTRLELTVNSLRALEVGQVVHLGLLRNAIIKVNDMPLCEGQAGVSNGLRSVRLIRRSNS